MKHGVIISILILKGVDLTLNITGSGDIEAENLQYTNLSAYIKGSGDIDVKNVKGTTVKTIVSGSGDVNRHCEMGCIDCKRLR